MSLHVATLHFDFLHTLTGWGALGIIKCGCSQGLPIKYFLLLVIFELCQGKVIDYVVVITTGPIVLQVNVICNKNALFL